MKTPPFLLIGCPVIIVVAAVIYAVTYPSLHRTMFHAALIAAEQPASTATEQDPTAAYNRARQMRWAFNQLGLNEAQKQQITQIRQTITDRQQRHEAIMQVLTPAQRTEWERMRDTDYKQQTAPPASNLAPVTNGI